MYISTFIKYREQNILTPQEEKVETLITVVVPPGHNTPTRLDMYLTAKLPNATRTKVQDGIKEGHVLVNGSKPKASQLVQPNDVIECTILKPPPIEALPEDIPLDIRYEDEWLIVLNKPAGMVVHPAYGNRSGTLINALLHHVGAGAIRLDDLQEDEEEEEEVENNAANADEVTPQQASPQLSLINATPRYKGDPSIRPGLVHRLDKDTSGLMVIAKDDAVHVHLANQFAKRTISRRYRAILWGILKEPTGTVSTYLGRDKRDRKLVAVLPDGQGKHAITHYTVLETLNYFSFVEFRLETGRTHQIRVHAKHLGHSCFGDKTYGGDHVQFALAGSSTKKAFFDNLFKVLPRQALHAYTLGFVHPVTGETLHFTADLPDDMQHVWAQLTKMGF